MKLRTIVISLLLIPLFSYSQDSIPLEKKYFTDKHYLYQLEVSINGFKTKLVIDTGASISSLKSSFVEKLLDADKISLDDIYATKENVVGISGKTQLMSVNIKNLKIQKVTFEDVKFWISKNEDIPNIIGLNLLERFDVVEIDFKKHKLKTNY